MKKIISIIFAAVILAAALCACGEAPAPTEPTQAAETAAPTQAPVMTEAPTEAPAEAITEPAVGELSSYVRTGRENTVSFDDGTTATLRLPEFLIESADANAANQELLNAYGDAVTDDTYGDGAYYLDYDAYLNENILSVAVTSKYNGGNSYGMVFNFDVLTGSKLDNTALCTAADRDYDEMESRLTTALTQSYDEKWGNLGGNESMREKTLSENNIEAAELYLNERGNMMALVTTYAAVGGGHFIMQVEIE